MSAAPLLLTEGTEAEAVMNVVRGDEAQPEAVQPAEQPTRAAAELLDVPLSDVYLPFNYRERREKLNRADLESLAEGIRATGGLIHAVPMRRLPEPIEGKNYALTAGFSRFAAHELVLEWPTIRAMVLDMTEQEAEAARIVENLHRSNPHPLDEAAAVAQLLAGREGEPGRTYQEVAAMLGKDTRWVAQRRGLTELAAEWTKGVYDGLVTLSSAEELARWPLDVQKRLFDKWGGRYSLQHSSLKGWLEQENRVLSAAPWPLSDAELVPEAGACSNCPKRSGCATVLFAELAKKDNCLDAACWNTKLTAEISRKQQELSTEEQPAVLLSNFYYGDKGLAPSKYETTRKKKEGVWGVYVDGPKAGHKQRVILQGVAAVAPSGKAVTSNQPTRGEVMRENRQRRATTEMEKTVLMERMLAGITNEDAAVSAEHITGILRVVIDDKFRARRGTMDEQTLQTLIDTFGWEKRTKEEYSERDWMTNQINRTCQTLDSAMHLLMWAMITHNADLEYEQNQQDVAKRMKVAAVQDGFKEQLQERLGAIYDLTTWKPKKK
ncbi:ParB N-terminal domain-containing protein [Hymenobacter sp. NST-14]|uniref:ParB/RepB/Spo0J family partition protein n=1 Tax=Hymenobacter piscis TaxID=2839984 RepID=UPI001C00E33F|nr:ParB N-terminal domain-containing protein [Hymenobacter piscis]MBT9394344.1 ParB N-terminal domain-containing protein [Hymenobacter piscis]